MPFKSSKSSASLARQVSLLSLLPSGAVWAIDGSATGTPDSDGNVPVDSVRDLVGSTHLTSPATAARKPRHIPTDYLLNGRKSLLFWNDALITNYQRIADPTTDNPLWKPLVEIRRGTSVSFACVFIQRGAESNQHLFGNFAGGVSTPGMYLLTDGSGVLQWASWNSGIRINVTSAPGVVPKGRINRLIFRIDGTTGDYRLWVNGTLVFTGTASAGTAPAATLSNAWTVGTYCGGEAVSTGVGEFGGNIGCQALWHRALLDAEVTALDAALQSFYEPALPVFDSAPRVNMAAKSAVDVAILGTSVDLGFNDEAADGYAGQIRTVIAPGWGDLALTFQGGNTGAGGTKVCAVGGMSIRGTAPGTSAIGFDSIAPGAPHSLDLTTQTTTMNSQGAFAVGRTLVIVCPIGWLNDLRLSAISALAYDHAGDLVRMLVRFVARIRTFDSGKDMRIVLHTCTPSGPSSNGEQEIHNRAASLLRAAVERATGCPTLVVDAYTPIQANRVTDLDADNLHLTATGHRTRMAPLIANAIRYASGRT